MLSIQGLLPRGCIAKVAISLRRVLVLWGTHRCWTIARNHEDSAVCTIAWAVVGGLLCLINSANSGLVSIV